MNMHLRATPDGKIESLRRLPLLRGCSTGELTSLAAGGDVIELHSGSPLKVEGRDVGWVHIVLEGDVVRTCNGQVLDHRGPSTLVGEAELLAGRRSAESVTAVTPVRALAFGRRQFHAVLDMCPSFRNVVLRSLSHQVADAPVRRPVLASVYDLFSTPAIAN